MELITYQRGDISHVALIGRLDAQGVGKMEHVFAEATSGRGLPTVVDVSGITFMTSLGIGMLFANTRKLKKAGCKLVLFNPQGMVETVLRTSKMEKLMPIVFEFAEAVRSVGGDPAIVSVLAPANRDSATAEASSDSAKSIPAENVLKLAITNSMPELEGLYAAVNQFLERHHVPYRSGYAVNLALEELVVNIIRYAYMDDDPHQIDIGIGIVEGQVILELRDSGRPFDPREAPPHDVEDEDLEVGGLGLVLVLDIVDSLTYRRQNDANHVQVCIRLSDEDEGRLWSAESAAQSTGDDQNGLASG